MKKKTLLVIVLALLLTLQSAFAEDVFNVAGTDRISGKDRYETAIHVAERFINFYSDLGFYVVLASGNNFPDALSGVPLTSPDLPMILSKKNSIPHTENFTIYDSVFFILGGKGAIGEQVENSIFANGGSILRISGSDRYETSVEIAKYVMSWNEPKDVIIVSGTSFADSISASNLYEFTGGAPIILVKKNSIPQVTKDFMNDYYIDNIYIVGGKGVVSNSVENELKGYCNKVTRLSGKDRYLTNLAVINYVGGLQILTNYNYGPYRYLILVTGKNFPDGLSAGVFATRGDLIMLVSNNLKEEQVEELINYKEFENKVTVVGGKGAVSERVQYETTNYLNYGYKKYILADGTEKIAKIGTKEDSRDRLLANINSYRAENGLAPLKYEYSWLPACNLRAVETMVTPSPYRPDGSYFDTAFVGDTFEMDKPVAEDHIRIGEGSPRPLFEELKINKVTNANLLNPNFTKIMFCSVFDPSTFGFRNVLVYK